MPPAFSEDEKATITKQLLDAGYDLFTRQGLRRTSLEELTGPAGIAKSSFYVFFGSKEELYLELMARQASDVKHRVIDAALLAGEDTRAGLRRFLRATLDEFASNPLWRRLTSHPEEMAAVARKVTAERAGAIPDNPAAALVEFVARKRNDGELVDADPAVIVGVLQTVLLVPLHAERLDPTHYPAIVDLLVDIVANGLAGPVTRNQLGPA